MTTPVFDGHNDVLLRLWMAGDTRGEGFIHGMDAHIDALKARKGGLIGGFFAIFVPEQNSSGEAILGTDPVSRHDAEDATRAMMAIFHHLTTCHPEVIRMATSAADLRQARSDGVMAAILHIEGAEAIAPDLSNLDDYYDQGLRSIGPVWSRQNAFGSGVPFGFPGSPDQGDGLTEAGVELVRAMNRKGMLIDLSHLNEAGFWDVARHSSAPLVATHSNAHALSASPRNLTDKQLMAIRESGGLVGLNFAAGFLRADGAKSTDTSIDIMIRHLDHLIAALGEDGVALGSDFDGAVIPQTIGSAAGLPVLISAMADAGYGDELINKITHGNWLAMVETTIG
ncbi:MAG: dipeptidase [Alphaproteobacteria bacterium]|nr:dipeptidase [Alphaproteobacteria bacterium]